MWISDWLNSSSSSALIVSRQPWLNLQLSPYLHLPIYVESACDSVNIGVRGVLGHALRPTIGILLMGALEVIGLVVAAVPSFVLELSGAPCIELARTA